MNQKVLQKYSRLNKEDFQDKEVQIAYLNDLPYLSVYTPNHLKSEPDLINIIYEKYPLAIKWAPKEILDDKNTVEKFIKKESFHWLFQNLDL